MKKFTKKEKKPKYKFLSETEIEQFENASMEELLKFFDTAREQINTTKKLKKDDHRLKELNEFVKKHRKNHKKNDELESLREDIKKIKEEIDEKIEEEKAEISDKNASYKDITVRFKEQETFLLKQMAVRRAKDKLQKK